MARADGLADWLDMDLGAPEIARLGAARLTKPRTAMLGTLRRDRSPRISPIEPYIVNGRPLAGAMAWSAKAADLRRHPRYALHSAVTCPDSGEGELKLHGRAVQYEPPMWVKRPGKIHASLAELAASGSGSRSPRNTLRGTGTRRQATPFQCSTSAPQPGPPLPKFGWPSAQASRGPVAATDVKLSSPQCRSTATIRQPATLAAPTAGAAPAAASSRPTAQIATGRGNRIGTGKP